MSKSAALRVIEPVSVKRSRAKERKRLPVGINTQQRLLDAAELLFSEYGYEGTSLRTIAEAADEHVGLTTYFFKTKDRLFDSVIPRRGVGMHRQRLAGLKEIGFDARTPLGLIRAIIWEFGGPVRNAG